MAVRAPSPKGRYWVLLWLGLFLAVALMVVARQKASLETARRLARLRETRAVLEARRAGLERTIKTQSSALVIEPEVAGDGLAVRQDTAYTYLKVEGGPAARPDR